MAGHSAERINKRGLIVWFDRGNWSEGGKNNSERVNVDRCMHVWMDGSGMDGR